MVAEEGAASLSPANRLALSVAPEHDWVVGDELEYQVKEGAVHCEPETPPDLHFSFCLINYKPSYIVNPISILSTDPIKFITITIDINNNISF